MNEDTIRGYLGRLVHVNTDMGRSGRPSFYGKVLNCDGDFITLNPFRYEFSECRSDKDAIREMGGTIAGSTDRQITIGRRTILTILEVREK